MCLIGQYNIRLRSGSRRPGIPRGGAGGCGSGPAPGRLGPSRGAGAGAGRVAGAPRECTCRVSSPGKHSGISPLTAEYECPLLPLLIIIITSDLETNKTEPRSYDGRVPNDRVCKLNGHPPWSCHACRTELGYDNCYDNSMAGGSPKTVPQDQTLFGTRPYTVSSHKFKAQTSKS